MLKAALSASVMAAILTGGVQPREAFAAAEQSVGTIQATLDGQPRVWYMLDSGEVSGATWMQLAPGRYRAVLIGFEASASASGAVEGSQVTISFEYSTDSAGAHYQLPTPGAEAEPASVRLMPAVRDLSRVHVMQQGTVTLEAVSVRDRQTFSFAGTFAGDLRDDDGKVVGRIEDGTFRADQATHVAAH